MDVPAFRIVLANLQGPWINAAVGILFSLVADYVPWYAGLGPKAKRVVMALVCLAVPLSSASLAVLLGYQPATLDATFWPAIWMGAVAFSTSTATHTREL